MVAGALGGDSPAPSLCKHIAYSPLAVRPITPDCPDQKQAEGIESGR